MPPTEHPALDMAPPHRSPADGARIRLAHLHGVRGLAALYVVLSHVYQECNNSLLRRGNLPVGFRWMDCGHFAVSIFILLSGYCLMLPVARSADRQLGGGIYQFIRRRARRILPPYYAALAAVLLLVTLVPGLQRPAGTLWDNSLPMLTRDMLLSHLFLVQDLRDAWHYGINGVMWSIAPEWQIYFVFALLLLPLWRRAGILVTLTAAFALGLAPHFVLGSYDWACPWYLGLFALGMAGALIGFSREKRYRKLAALPWRTITGALFVMFMVVINYGFFGVRIWLWQVDCLAGLAAFSLLVYLGECARTTSANPGGGPLLYRMLCTKPVVGLGTISYSLYLMHFPVLDLLYRRLVLFPGPQVKVLLLLFSVGVPLSLLVSYLFHLVFERPFMSELAR